MVRLLEKASAVIPVDQLWVNPDCGLKTRHWHETQKALIEMKAAVEKSCDLIVLPRILLFFYASERRRKLVMI